MRLAIVLSLALAACVSPSQHNEAHYGVVTIGFGPSLDGMIDWRQDQLAQLRQELPALNALGPTFNEASEGSADIVVRPIACDGLHAAGQYTPGTRFVEVSPDAPCTQGYLELQAAMAHEIGHALGMHHVCFSAGEAPDCDTRVGVGPAIMNPHVSYGDVLDMSISPGDPTGVPSTEPTQLDLDEYRRVHP